MIEENAKSAPRKVDFLAPGDQRHVLLNLLNRVARHVHEVFHCWLMTNARPFNL
ncbi:hypothetical protein [Sinorhizobium americanum]|uniref:hypothetical protein n=1 Tax=Sinorhizobium americanum TaxID=194963 RepID=UPI001A7E1352|nr:hypothetical protein [Sinorhizobium americanum]